MIGKDLVNNPELAKDPEVAAELACLFFSKRGCNELADKGDFVGITKKINGGTNGLKDREERYENGRKK